MLPTGCLERVAGDRQGRRLAAACDLDEPDPVAAVRLTEPPHDLAVGVTTEEVDVVGCAPAPTRRGR